MKAKIAIAKEQMEIELARLKAMQDDLHAKICQQQFNIDLVNDLINTK